MNNLISRIESLLLEDGYDTPNFETLEFYESLALGSEYLHLEKLEIAILFFEYALLIRPKDYLALQWYALCKSIMTPTIPEMLSEDDMHLRDIYDKLYQVREIIDNTLDSISEIL